MSERACHELRTPHLRLPIGRLQPGDFLPGSRTTILTRPTKTVRTAPGKVELDVRRDNGDAQHVTWSQYTLVTIDTEHRSSQA